MQKASVKERIVSYNKGRDPEILALKYKTIADNEFSFYRGTCHLFYEDLPKDSAFNKAPNTWICGDLHLENFGCYKGSNRLTYFDLSDCDEAVLAPCTWEITRFLVSVIVGAKSIKLNQNQALTLCDTFLDSYINALKKGEAYCIERATAIGMIEQLMISLEKRSRAAFINSRTTIKKGKRKLKLDNGRALAVSEVTSQKITSFMYDFAQNRENPEFFKVLDVARRIAGTSSLGMERYAILVEGNAKKAKGNNYLLDLKLCSISAAQPYLNEVKQPHWNSEAERVVSIQHRLQAVSPAFLSAVKIDDKSYVLKELLPTQDRLSLIQAKGKIKPLQDVIKHMGEIVAWAELRTSGSQDSAIVNDLTEFAAEQYKWRKDLMEYVKKYAAQVTQDWQQYRQSLRNF